jgi:hypothetical protein
MASPRRETLPERAHHGSQPWTHQHSQEIQSFGTVRQFPLGLAYNARLLSCERLNQILADSQILYALYKKHHWLMRGPTFYQLHLLLDKHAGEQIKLIDEIAGMSPRSPACRARRTAAKRCPPCCLGSLKPTNSSSWTPTTPPGGQPT